MGLETLAAQLQAAYHPLRLALMQAAVRLVADLKREAWRERKVAAVKGKYAGFGAGTEVFMEEKHRDAFKGW